MLEIKTKSRKRIFHYWFSVQEILINAIYTHNTGMVYSLDLPSPKSKRIQLKHLVRFSVSSGYIFWKMKLPGTVRDQFNCNNLNDFIIIFIEVHREN
ncbi:Hypothetical predicted protein [Octopus vulgaris]|uniref:Uncharacterized protein n=1 Tax=Octopus vulgaris TaxID=6645 RepID=A0AA36AT91_OCTVU|nr:Hypothetical predicted protein [Octopus vulgaris]